MEPNAEVEAVFPSIVDEDTSGPPPYQAAQFHLRQALQAISDLVPGTDPEKLRRRTTCC